MTAAPVTATCTAVFPLAGGPAVTCDRQPHTTRLHTAEIDGVPFAWSDRDVDALPDWERATLSAVRAVYGDDLPRTRAGRIEAVGCAMLTLAQHVEADAPSEDGDEFWCLCGWAGESHPRHLAEQLYATGALDRNAPAVANVVKAARDLREYWRALPGVDRFRAKPQALIAAVDALNTGGGS